MTPGVHGHAPAGHDHAPAGHDHAAAGHDHAAAGHDHAAAGHDHVAAWVDGEPVPASRIDGELARLRQGARAALLPRDGTAEGRQLRRWITQTVVVEQLLDGEAARRALPPGPPVAQVLPDRPAALAVGGVCAAVLRRSAAARAVWADVTRAVRADADAVRAHQARNPDRDPARAEQELHAARQRQAFLDWLSASSARRVRLAPGHEHPGDPQQPDATHRH